MGAEMIELTLPEYSAVMLGFAVLILNLIVFTRT